VRKGGALIKHDSGVGPVSAAVFGWEGYPVGVSIPSSRQTPKPIDAEGSEYASRSDTERRGDDLEKIRKQMKQS